MTEWVLVSPMLTVLIGACAAMVSHIIYPPKAGEVAVRIALFSISMAAVQIAILGFRAYGLSPSGLFRLDGMSLSFSLIATVFLFAGAVGLYLEKNPSWPYTSTALLLLATTALTGLFANDGLLLYLAIGTLTVFSRWSSSIWSEKVNPNAEGGGILGALGWIVFTGFCLILLLQAVGSGRYELIEKSVGSMSHNAGFNIGFFGLLIVQSFGFMPAPIDPYFSQSLRTGQWSAVIISKLIVPVIFFLLAMRWMWIFGFDSELNPRTPVDLSIVIGIGITVILSFGLWNLLTKQSCVRIFCHFGIQSLCLGLLPFFLKAPVLLQAGFSHMLLTGLASVLGLSALRELRLPTNAPFLMLREAAQKAPLRVQFMIGFSLMTLVLPFALPSKLLFQALWTQLFLGEEAVVLLCSTILLLMTASLLLMSVRVVQIFAQDAERNSEWGGGTVREKIWAYSLFAVVLVLGVYPTPLYNYFAHSIRLFLKVN